MGLLCFGWISVPPFTILTSYKYRGVGEGNRTDPITFGYNVAFLLASFFPKTLKMGQTSDPETLVIHQKHDAV
jgi:hypothetical protein